MANTDSNGSNGGGGARSFAPGTFEQTRKNIGPLSPEEALEMTKKLGGEILPERSQPIDTSNMPKKKRKADRVRASGISASEAS